MSSAAPLSSEQRCACGQLLAILLEEGIEIKCRRCKRLERISFETLSNFFKSQGPVSPDSSWPDADAVTNAFCKGHSSEGKTSP